MSSSNQSVLERLFNLNANQTNVRTEIMAGVTTFLAMCYIIIVNPLILGETGMDMGAVFVATCIASAIGCFVMGFVGNYPIALAPGMGLNAYFTFAVVKGMGVDWRVALGAVFISGIIFILFSFFKVREMLVNALPMGLKMSIAAGIGLFLALFATSQRSAHSAGPREDPIASAMTQPRPISAHTTSAISPDTATPSERTPKEIDNPQMRMKSSVWDR